MEGLGVVYAAVGPRMTAHYAPQAFCYTFQRPVLENCLLGVLGARRIIGAVTVRVEYL